MSVDFNSCLSVSQHKLLPTNPPQVAKRLQLGVITPIPTPYRDPFWSEVANLPGVGLKVYYCSAGKADRPWTINWKREYELEILKGINLASWRSRDASCFWNQGLKARLQQEGFDALIIGGYNHVTMWQAMRYAVRSGTPFFLMCESTLQSQRGGWRRILKRPALRWIIRHAAGVFPTGSLAAQYLAEYGASPSSMTMLPNVPDVERIAEHTSQLRQNGVFPGPLEFAGKPIVLFVGRLIPKKRAELLIRALASTAHVTDAILVLLGDGPLRPSLEELVRELGIESRVHFAGFVQPEDVPRWLAFSKLFVLPSSETWGVAVIEALASGVPVVVSNEIGCVTEVVRHEALGEIVPARDLRALSDAVQRRLAMAPAPEQFQDAWRPVRRSLSYSHQAESFVAAIETAIGSR